MHKLSKPQCRIIGIQRGQNVQDEGAKELGANKPENKQAKGRRSQAQGANQPGGEPPKGRKSQTPSNHPSSIIVYVLTVSQSITSRYLQVVANKNRTCANLYNKSWEEKVGQLLMTHERFLLAN